MFCQNLGRFYEQEIKAFLEQAQLSLPGRRKGSEGFQTCPLCCWAGLWHPGVLTVPSYPRFHPGLYSWQNGKIQAVFVRTLAPSIPQFCSAAPQSRSFCSLPCAGLWNDTVVARIVLQGATGGRGGCGKAWKTKPAVSSLLPGSKIPRDPTPPLSPQKPHQVFPFCSEGWSSSPVRTL